MENCLKMVIFYFGQILLVYMTHISFFKDFLNIGVNIYSPVAESIKKLLTIYDYDSNTDPL